MIKKQLYRMRWKGFQLKKRITDILCDEKGIGVVEVILILVVLIGLHNKDQNNFHHTDPCCADWSGNYF